MAAVAGADFGQANTFACLAGNCRELSRWCAL